MAELHKMTLYICDLNEELDISEIKTLIDNALNGMSGNCLIRIADAKMAENPIEWDDNIDINYIDATDEQWEAYFGRKETKDDDVNNNDKTTTCEYHNRPEYYEKYVPAQPLDTDEPLYKRVVMFNDINPVAYCSSCKSRLCSRFTNFCPNCGRQVRIKS